MIGNRYILDAREESIDENRLYQARDVLEEEKVFLKIINANRYIKKDFIENLIDISTTVNDLGNRYILKLKNIGIHYKDNGEYCYYMAYEYIDGVELSELIAGNYLHPEAIMNISVEILKALESIHSIDCGMHGMYDFGYHGSLKMNDIIVDKNYNVKIADFGITAANRGENIRAKGNYQYMSAPQICINYTDKESDLFAFGIILYEMIFKRRPFGTAKNEKDMLSRIDRGPDYRNIKVQKSYEKLVEIDKRLLSRKNKFKDCKEAIVELTGVLYQNTIETERIEVPENTSIIDLRLIENENKLIKEEQLRQMNRKIGVIKRSAAAMIIVAAILLAVGMY